MCATEEQALLDISTSCREVGEDLLKRLSGLKLQGTRTEWKSLQQATKAAISEKDLKTMVERLLLFKETVETHVLVGIR